jgi:hypothetical protein
VLFEADRKWCSACAKVKIVLLKAKLDVVTVSKAFTITYEYFTSFHRLLLFGRLKRKKRVRKVE